MGRSAITENRFLPVIKRSGVFTASVRDYIWEVPITDYSGAVDQSGRSGLCQHRSGRYQYRVASNRCGSGKIGVVVQAATLMAIGSALDH